MPEFQWPTTDDWVVVRTPLKEKHSSMDKAWLPGMISEDTDEARLRAYEELREMVRWLHLPIEDPTIYD